MNESSAASGSQYDRPTFDAYTATCRIMRQVSSTARDRRGRSAFIAYARRSSTLCSAARERIAQRRAACRPDDQLTTVADARGERGAVVRGGAKPPRAPRRRIIRESRAEGDGKLNACGEVEREPCEPSPTT